MCGRRAERASLSMVDEILSVPMLLEVLLEAKREIRAVSTEEKSNGGM